MATRKFKFILIFLGIAVVAVATVLVSHIWAAPSAGCLPGTSCGAINVDSYFDVGVGTTSPPAAYPARFLIYASSTVAPYSFGVYSFSGTPLFLIDDNGNVTTTGNLFTPTLTANNINGTLAGLTVNSSQITGGVFGGAASSTQTFAFPSNLSIGTNTQFAQPGLFTVYGTSTFTGTSTFNSGAYFGGNVGIQVKNPYAALTIGNSSGDGTINPANGLVFSDTNQGQSSSWLDAAIYTVDGSNYTGSLIFATGQGGDNNNSVERMRIANSGNIGIGGDTAPSALLSMGVTTTAIKIATYDPGNGSGNLYGMGVLSNELTFGANIAANGTPQMVLTNNGVLEVTGGVGGNVDFTVNGRMQSGDSNNSGGLYVNSGDTEFVGQDTANLVGLYNNGYWGVAVNGSGQVGINTASPSYELDVENGTGAGAGQINAHGGLCITGVCDTWTPWIEGNYVSGWPYIYAAEGGISVGINTNGAPAYKLDVEGGQVNGSGGFCISGDNSSEGEGNCISQWNQLGWYQFGYGNYQTGMDTDHVGAVGIGLASYNTPPGSYTLDVGGSTNSNGGYCISGDNSGNGVGQCINQWDDLGWYSTYNSQWNADYMDTEENVGNGGIARVGIAIGNGVQPGYTLDVGGSTNSNGGYCISGDNSGNGVGQCINQWDDLGWYSTYNSQWNADYMDTEENVGNGGIARVGIAIGNGVQPGYTLQVGGTVYATEIVDPGLTSGGQGFNCIGSTAGGQLEAGTCNGGTGTPDFWTQNGTNIIYYDGDVGINDAVPLYPLDVDGSIRATGMIDSGLTNQGCIGTDPNGNFIPGPCSNLMETGSFNNIQVFTSNGTWNLPTGTTEVWVEVYGGGGGGGGSTSGAFAGGGGGAGGVAQGYVTVSGNMTVTVGAGGAAGTASSNGGNGGSSSFGTLTANGGGGGYYGTASLYGVGGLGGSATNGNIDQTGGMGGSAQGSSGAPAPNGGSNNRGAGGEGGNATTGSTGSAGNTYGGGGGGGETANGGAGGGGGVIVWW